MFFDAKRFRYLAVTVVGLVILTFGSESSTSGDSSCVNTALGPGIIVSPVGDDSWSGRLSEPNAERTDGPFATLERARNEMRRDTAIDRSYLRGGRYDLAVTLNLTSKDSGITFASCAGETPIISGSQIGIGTIIALDDADGVSILGLTFKDVDAGTNDSDKERAFALNLNYVEDATIADNTFLNVNIAINVSRSSNNSILSNEIGHVGYQAIRLDNADYNAILGNHIYDIGTAFPQWSAGIKGRNIEDNTIAHNLIEDSAAYAISIKDGGTIVNLGNVVEYNKIFNTSQTIQDSGAIEMLGRSGIDTNTIIRYNYIENTGGDKIMASAIYLDDITSGVEIYGNFIKDTGMSGFHVHGGNDVSITNNIVILLDEPVYAPNGNMLKGHELFIYEQTGGNFSRPMENIEWSGNIISAPNGLTPDADYTRRSGGSDLSTPKVSNNLLHNVDAYDGPAAGTPEAGSISADPLFVDPANGDYALQTNSPAYDLGFEPLPFADMGLDGHRGGAN